MKLHRLIEARTRAGLSQNQIAVMLNISKQHYCRIENGQCEGRIVHWDALEDLFNIPQRQLRKTDRYIVADNVKEDNS